jgi:TRAP-type uncharacterized transport system substrate-binding protein
VIATGNATGVYAALGSGLADQIAATTPMKATAVQTGSTLRNVQQLSSGEYDVELNAGSRTALGQLTNG